ncbi:DUF4167 domain-containing protein [Shinella sp. CPCC 101442]|uniref:DUF4167 domain-containing protein n=1 Tax=Shinella sp. CPCC 101442 TaxID=2932265 RepID=UPI002152E52E|nr:DUF4167 domain-containing protein [Shinella sp. CPCC 101442]MCR6502700.1 DUF4167 domain-containing protein [Shinella sp. CPCC 101442]
MRPGQQNKRGRGRNNNSSNNNNNNSSNHNNHRKGGNPLTRTYDSSGPDVKIRGTAQHIAEKYSTLARDAQSAGDRVIAENYLQHAEHYNRIIAAAQAQMQERYPRDERADNADRGDDGDRDGYDQDDGDSMHADEPAPVAAAPVAKPAATPVAKPAAKPAVEQPVIDGSGPQPVIEGTPAEVALDEEAAAPAGRAPRRRNAARPRRPRRGEGEASGEEGASSGDDSPALEPASE